MTGPRVGLLLQGAPTHGVHRYALTLAEALRAAGVDVTTAEGGTHPDALREAAAALSACSDVVHVQYTRVLWGTDRAGLPGLRAFLDEVRRPVVATVHDLHVDLGPGPLLRRAVGRLRPDGAREPDDAPGRAPAAPPVATGTPRPPDRVGRLRHLLEPAVGAEPRALRTLQRAAAATVVCSPQEATRLAGLHAGPVEVVPHVVERRRLPERSRARRSLGLDTGRVVTLLGWVQARKGHDLAVAALPLLPPDVTLVLAGATAPGHEGLPERLRQAAREAGVADRLRITGWLDEEALDAHLAATDLALCPYRTIAASGSLATWLAADRPVLAFDVAYLRTLTADAPGAVATFGTWSPDALAAAATALLAGPDDPGPRRRLAAALSPARTADRHLAVYRRVLAR